MNEENQFINDIVSRVKVPAFNLKWYEDQSASPLSLLKSIDKNHFNSFDIFQIFKKSVEHYKKIRQLNIVFRKIGDIKVGLAKESNIEIYVLVVSTKVTVFYSYAPYNIVISLPDVDIFDDVVLLYQTFQYTVLIIIPII